MLPMPDELLPTALRLRCGLVVREWRGSPPDPARLDRLCALATERFHPFLREVGLTAPHRRPFAWSASVLPPGRCARCLNDLSSRFAGRATSQTVTGYTSFTHRHSFFGARPEAVHAVTVVHELFHAQSFHYGLFDQHASNDAERTRIDEGLARQYTAWLGLGR